MRSCCGYTGYDEGKLSFNSSLTMYIRKPLTPEVLGEINEMIMRDVTERQAQESKHGDGPGDALGQGRNSGTMIVDTT